MVDDRYRTLLVLDASPLIYLAKINAMEVFEQLPVIPVVPPAAAEETARPALLYRHPDAATIEQAIRDRTIEMVDLESAEIEQADKLGLRLPALHAGEREVLAVALERRMPAVLFERRARHVANAIGVQLIDIIELLFRGTPDHEQLARRLRSLAHLTNMRIADYDALTARVERRRLL
jgi:predicted nucleic acid-binding protein